MKVRFLLPVLLLMSCGGEPAADHNGAVASDMAADPSATLPPLMPGNEAINAEEPLVPPGPGEPGGLPDDRTPISEAPFTETSAQGAANVVQTYYALLEQGKYDAAWRLWSDGGKASGMSAQAFAESFAKYRDYHAQIGAPGMIEGAAGSLYVEVPVQVYGRMKDGKTFNMTGPVALRRVNDVPGSTPEQRRWHIATSGVKPRP